MVRDLAVHDALLRAQRRADLAGPRDPAASRFMARTHLD